MVSVTDETARNELDRKGAGNGLNTGAANGVIVSAAQALQILGSTSIDTAIIDIDIEDVVADTRNGSVLLCKPQRRPEQ